MSTLAVIRRTAIRYDVEELREELGEYCLPNVEVYIDKKNKADIEAVMALNPAKTRRALSLAMQGRYNENLYDREKISGKASNITAIKHKGKLNDRIYCQELMHSSKKIILITAYRKKGQNVDKRTATIIESAAKYVFDFQI